MKKDEFITEVIFRKEKDNSITAFFPYDFNDLDGNIICYAHLGQHSAADPFYYSDKTKPAKVSEYSDLKSELESIGYNLKVIKKKNYTRYLNALNEMRNR